jgi:hypothetical protein
MKKRIVPIILALFLALCVGMLNIAPAVHAVTYGPTFVLGSVSSIGTIGSVSMIYSLTYAENHKVYGVAYSTTTVTGSHLFAVDLDSGSGSVGPRGWYPLTLPTAVTDLGVPPTPSGFMFTPFNPSYGLGGRSLTAGYYIYTGATTHDLAIYGGGMVYGRTSPGAADLVVYDISNSIIGFVNLGFPTGLPTTVSGNPGDEAIYALATGIDGTIYGGTGYYLQIGSAMDFTYLFSYTPSLGTFAVLYQVPTSVGDRFISAIATGIYGEIYFLSQPSGTLWVYEPTTGYCYAVGTAVAGNRFTTLTVDLHGTVWLGDNGGNLYEYIPPYPPTLPGPIGTPQPIVSPMPAGLTIYGMAAGTHGIIYMAADVGTSGYLVIYDPRKPLSLGSLGTISTNPGSSTLPSPLATGLPYSLVECNEHGTIFGGTCGFSSTPAGLFYYYEAGNPDLLNDGIINIRPAAWLAIQWAYDPPAKSPLSTTYAAVAAFAVGLGVVAFAVILRVKKRQKKKP